MPTANCKPQTANRTLQNTSRKTPTEKRKPQNVNRKTRSLKISHSKRQTQNIKRILRSSDRDDNRTTVALRFQFLSPSRCHLYFCCLGSIPLLYLALLFSIPGLSHHVPSPSRSSPFLFLSLSIIRFPPMPTSFLSVALRFRPVSSATRCNSFVSVFKNLLLCIFLDSYLKVRIISLIIVSICMQFNYVLFYLDILWTSTRQSVAIFAYRFASSEFSATYVCVSCQFQRLHSQMA